MKTLMIAAGLALAATAAQAAPCEGKLLATVEADGTVSTGARDKVVQAARDGAALRVGWQVGPRDAPFLVHWQDARFVTVFEGHAFTQIGDIHRQTPLGGKAHVLLPGDFTSWHASIGTNGKMVHRYSNDAEVKETPVVSHWCLA